MLAHFTKFSFIVRSGRICSLETSLDSKCAGESHWTFCPHCGHPLHTVIRACSQRLLFGQEIFRGVDSKWANLANKASAQALNLLTTVQPGRMEAGLFCKDIFNTFLSLNQL
jgi:hypothetical protein